MTPDPNFAGDAALVLELEPRIDPAINARAIAVANAMRRQQVPGVRDVVSTIRSVAIHFDPLQTGLADVRRALDRACEANAIAVSGRHVEIPVVYGGEEGPDLAGVARWAGLSESEVIQRHSGRDYRVFMLGFVPGFAYMGVVDPAIASPRQATPRLKVPAGSVGIAGAQTGIYSRETPGGWQIIGRTDVALFDAGGEAPPLLAAGDVVTFKPVPRATSAAKARATETHPASARAITVMSPGILTTVQDLGRWGHQHEGVPVSGAMDGVSHRVANRSVGNPDTSATVEVTVSGPELRIEAPATVAIAGADLSPTLNGALVGMNTPMRVPAGSTLSFGARRSGARAYIAFDGGVDVPLLRGSRATDLASGMGGFHGRALRAGDRLPLGDPSGASPAHISRAPRSQPANVTLRVIPGPQRDFFDERGLDALTRTRFTVSLFSNRMAYRLTAAAAIPRASTREMISDATFAGGIQVTPDGQAILLMADRQTTGGYPQIATVITADLPVAGQLAPGDTLAFAVCTLAEARAALETQEGQFRVHR